VIEDNLADAHLVREALEEHQVEGELLVISDGEKALSFLSSLDAQPAADRPDLIIVDLNLPKRSGFEVLEGLRQSNACRRVPVVVLSSSGAEEDRTRAVRLGISRYIRKPLRLEQFLSLGAVFKAMLDGSVL
jgi:chemotaxis family two-component system response regulator Rcp1